MAAPQHPLSRPRSPRGRLGASYLLLAAVALLVGSALRVPAGPVLLMAIVLAANALVLAALERRAIG